MRYLFTLLVAGIPALSAIIAAIVAARSSHRIKKFETESQRTRDLESRIADKKYEVYKPMINLLSDMIGGQQPGEDEFKRLTAEFSTWIMIYGSDEAVKKYHDFMQAAYHSPPPVVLLHLYADFVIAARKDMGSPDTNAKPSHVVGMRINDIYESTTFTSIDNQFEQICTATGWIPPWN